MCLLCGTDWMFICSWGFSLSWKVVPWLRRLVAGLSQRRTAFDFRPMHVRFVVDKVAFGEVFLRVLRPSLSVSLHQCSIIIIYTFSRTRSLGTFQKAAPFFFFERRGSLGRKVLLLGLWPLTTEDRVRSQASSCEIYGGQSGTGTGFPPCSLTIWRLNAIFFIQAISPYRAVNTFHHGYKNQSVNDV